MLHSVAAEVRREQFSKAELDHMGYPTNAALATELGRCDARRDLTNGIVRVPRYGLPSPWSGEYTRILKEVYQIESYGLAGCTVSDGLMKYASGYSEISRSYVEAKYGTNIWRDVRRQAETAWEKLRSQPSENTGPLNRYRIRAGDTLTRIARQHGVTLKALNAANPNLDPTKLKIGQIILIPEQSKR
jgi:LysM repeat protein